MFGRTTPERIPLHQAAPTVQAVTVRRVDTGHGSRVEPRFDDGWSDGDKLAWKAAVVSLDTGLDVKVEAAVVGGSYGWHAYYDIRCFRSSSGPYRYEDAQQVLSGISIGAEARAALGEDPC